MTGNPDNSSAFRVIGEIQSEAPLFVICEHASNFLPTQAALTQEEGTLFTQHWGYDIGAAAVSEALVNNRVAQAVLAGFSRLFIDANRSMDSSTLIPTSIAGVGLSFNRDLNQSEREDRLRNWFSPYHRAIEDQLDLRLRQKPQPLLLSIHSFTPMYMGTARELEIGILFDQYEYEAVALKRALAAAGFRAELNQPYTGKGPSALIYSVKRHGERTQLPYLELEIRQDLVADPPSARAIATQLLHALKKSGLVS